MQKEFQVGQDINSNSELSMYELTYEYSYTIPGNTHFKIIAITNKSLTVAFDHATDAHGIIHHTGKIKRKDFIKLG